MVTKFLGKKDLSQLEISQPSSSGDLTKNDTFIIFFIAELTGTFLKREWLRSDGERENGAKYNESLQFLLRYRKLTVRKGY